MLRPRSRRPVRLSASAAVLLVVVTLTGCVSGGGRPDEGATPAERPFLLPPYEGWSGRLQPEAAQQLQQLFTSLVERNDQVAALNGALVLLEQDPDLLPARVLEAQVRHLGRSYATVLELLEPVLEADPGFVSAAVLSARAAEQIGLLVEAYEAYDAMRSKSAVAARRTADLLDAVVDELASRFDEQLGSGQQGAAAESLARLRRWAPEAEATRAAAAAFDAATADPLERLAMLRGLAGSGGDDAELTRRRAELEIEVGDAAVAVRLAEHLLAQKPHDLYATHLLERARFQWRLNLLPQDVRALARRPELTRADFAVLLYWLFPQVRYGRTAEARIATDVIDHPHSEAIVRVINLGLLEVDPTVHRFAPESRLERHQALRAFLHLMAQSEEGAACMEGGRVPSAVEFLCRAAYSCQLLAEEGECLPGTSLSGNQSLELARRVLLRLPSE